MRVLRWIVGKAVDVVIFGATFYAIVSFIEKN